MVLVMALPLDFSGKLRVLRTKFLPGDPQWIEASGVSFGSLLKLGSGFVAAV